MAEAAHRFLLLTGPAEKGVRGMDTPSEHSPSPSCHLFLSPAPPEAEGALLGFQPILPAAPQHDSGPGSLTRSSCRRQERHSWAVSGWDPPLSLLEHSSCLLNTLVSKGLGGKFSYQGDQELKTAPFLKLAPAPIPELQGKGHLRISQGPH